MRRLVIGLAAVAVTASASLAADLTAGLHWFGHDAFRLDGPPVVYVDPFQLPDGLPPTDVILITHAHFDHCSPADAARFAKLLEGSGITVVIMNKEQAR